MSESKLHSEKFSKIYLFTYPKGQIISEQNCGVLNFPKNNEIIARIIDLASKIGQIKKK